MDTKEYALEQATTHGAGDTATRRLPMATIRPINNHPITRASARGSAIGAINLTVFGAIWAFNALGAYWPQAPGWAFGVLVLAAAALAIFGAVRLVAASRLPREDAQAARQWRAAERWLGIIFAIQILLIAAAAIILARAGRPLLIPVVVAAIVGLHFWPLARVFHMPIFWGIGALLLICAAASLLIENANARALALSLAAALVLWVSAAIMLIRYTGHGASGALTRSS